ncbi:hypothetical protein KVR01_004799 [Diaporthe batatas]|uniref:uncharacterized protein n=1 Tax=Diaporthe batatas TaxID=748121 RepID=UPI001D059323|nr:uncharacterized protein KVR01_004799 [Diaporthe batatas]KAG8166247.1 hypothetical protein KVR01_004799 [Diaporthe batatas]
MYLRTLARSNESGQSGRNTLIIAISIGAGVVIAISAIIVGLKLVERRRKSRQRFKEAQSRDPTLTWDEHDRRCKLTRSRLLVEEEMQRHKIIRKTQQSRASNRMDPDQAGSSKWTRPTRSRSKTWHGRAKSINTDVETGPRIEERCLDWGSAEAHVLRTFQVLNGKKHPSQSPRRSEDDGNVPRRPPTIRLKTPPLFSHPMFRSSGNGPPKHLSLPSELIRIHTDPGPSVGPAIISEKSQGEGP